MLAYFYYRDAQFFSLLFNTGCVCLHVQLILFMSCGLVLTGGLNVHLIIRATGSVLNHSALKYFLNVCS